MEYTGNIVYEMFNVMGSKKLSVTYKVQGSDSIYEITRIVITPHEESSQQISLNIQEELEDILEECVRDFTKQNNIALFEITVNLKAPIVDDLSFKLANPEYDFSAN